jgi:hypothetical protein
MMAIELVAELHVLLRSDDDGLENGGWWAVGLRLERVRLVPMPPLQSSNYQRM